jgi:TetR/AcrR family transcriptional regulator, tetracycline repressor protein
MSDTPDVIPPPPWQRVPQRVPRRRADPLTTDAIVDAALRVLDAEGLDSLTMRRVGEELGASAASLYWHVGSKEGLLDLLLDRVIGEMEVPEPEPERWQEQLKQVALAMRATILRHRDIVRISIGRVPMGPNSLRYSERVLAILRSGGVPDELAVHGQLLLFSVVNGFTMDETGQGGAPPPDMPPIEEVAKAVRDYFAALPADAFPNLIAVADHFTITDQDRRFELLIDIYVDGLAKLADP